VDHREADAMDHLTELVPWVKFKQGLFDIYSHRIQHAAEINSMLVTNYCTLNEHLLLFFMDKVRKRGQAEENLVRFLINLYYYYDIWTRAKLMAMNLQLIRVEST